MDMLLVREIAFGDSSNTRDSKHLPKQDIFADYINAVRHLPEHVSAVSSRMANRDDTPVQLTDNAREKNSRFVLKSVYITNQRANKSDR